MNRDDAIDKIRKLLNSKGRTEAEADTANIIAAALAAKHDIDIAELDRLDQQRQAVITHKIVGEWSREPVEVHYASAICKCFFEIDTFIRVGWTTKRIFVGTAHHLQIAEYVLQFLTGEFRRAWNRRANKRIKNRSEFIKGAYLGLYMKLDERFHSDKSPQMELSLEVSWKAKRQAYIDENFGELETLKRKASSNIPSAARAHGLRAGESIEIRPGVDGRDAKKADQLMSGGVKLLTG